jgi:hypothetical protein
MLLQRKTVKITAMLALFACLRGAIAVQAVSPGKQDSAHSVEYSLKSAFIYNFALFIDWPESAFPGKDSPFVIGIVGSDPFGSILDQVLEDKTAKGRRFAIRRLGLDSEIKNCHMLFIREAGSRDMEQLKNLLKNSSVLTVGENEEFYRNGGMIRMVLENKKVSLEVNATAAKQERLSISSKLLNLAKAVK